MTAETTLTEPDAMSIMAGFGEHSGEHGYGRYDKWQALDAARAIEQAVLQSPEVQRLREDAARLDWVEKNLDVAMTREDMDHHMKKRGKP